MKFHGFHGNPLCDFKKWGYTYKILISQQHLILDYQTWNKVIQHATILQTVYNQEETHKRLISILLIAHKLYVGTKSDLLVSWVRCGA